MLWPHPNSSFIHVHYCVSLDDYVKQRHEFTNMNGKYCNYQKVGKIACMCMQFVPGSFFLCATHTKSLGTRLGGGLRYSIACMFGGGLRYSIAYACYVLAHYVTRKCAYIYLILVTAWACVCMQALFFAAFVIMTLMFHLLLLFLVSCACDYSGGSSNGAQGAGPRFFSYQNSLLCSRILS